MKNLLVLISSLAVLSACTPKSSESAVYIASEEFAKLNLPFSEAVIHDDIIYLSGQIGNVGMTLVEGGIEAETHQAMQNVRKILEANGSSMNNIIKCTCMLADMNEWPGMNDVYITYFPDHKPARSALGANGLALGARVEIECMAYINN